MLEGEGKGGFSAFPRGADHHDTLPLCSDEALVRYSSSWQQVHKEDSVLFQLLGKNGDTNGDKNQSCK